MKVVTSCFIALSLLFASSAAIAQQKVDSVAVIVDNTIVLESEISNMINSIKRSAQQAGRSLPTDEVLRTQVVERLILQKLQMQMGERMGIRIGDAQLDQTIANIAAENELPIDAMQAQIEADGSSWRQYREELREQLVTNEVQRSQVQRRVYISPQEISNLVRMIDEQGDSTIEYNLSHILISFQNEAGEADEEAARNRVDAVMQRLQDNADFAQMAVTSSSASNALDGGEMGWMSPNSMPTLFAANIGNAQAGDLIGPLRSGVGFHILKVNELRGAQTFTSEEVNARHILIQPSVILSDNRAERMLHEFREQIINGEKSFGELAQEHSADPGSARNNGELGFTDPAMYVPEFRQRVETQDIGVISEPFRSTHGWHIVEVLERRTQDVTDQRKREQAANMLFTRKYREELDIWLQELRDNAYVEVVR